MPPTASSPASSPPAPTGAEAAAPRAVLLLGAPLPSVREALEGAVTLHGPIEDLMAGPLPDGITAIAVSRARKVTAEGLARLPGLELIANFGVGYDNIDAEAAAARGITVTNTPDVLTEEVADLTLGLLLATVRELPQAERHVRDGRWRQGPFRFSASLRTRSIGIVGLGRIGRAVARRLEPFGVPLAYHGRRRQPDVPYRHYPALKAMAEDVDTLVCIAPGGPATRHMIDAAILEALGPEGIVINVGRGSVIDEQALVTALASGRIRGAGLDVFEHEPAVPEALLAMEQVVLLPHVGSATHHTRHAMGEVQVANLLAWARGEAPPTPVAETPWPPARRAGPRAA